MLISRIKQAAFDKEDTEKLSRLTQWAFLPWYSIVKRAGPGTWLVKMMSYHSHMKLFLTLVQYVEKSAGQLEDSKDTPRSMKPLPL